MSEKIAQLVIDKFKKDILKDLDELKKLIEKKDKEEISKKAHFIKNSCLNVAFR